MVMDNNQNKYYTKIAEIIADETNVFKGNKHYNIKFPYMEGNFYSLHNFLEEYDPVSNYIPFNHFKIHVIHSYGIEGVEVVKVWQIYVDVIKDKYVYKNR